MMSSTPKQPRKKCRIDAQGSKDANVPPEVSPLVVQNQAPKKAVGTKRGSYPNRGRAKNKNNLGSFVNASELLKESSKCKDKSSKSMDDGLCFLEINKKKKTVIRRTLTRQKEAQFKICKKASISGTQFFKTSKITSFFEVKADGSSKEKEAVNDTAESNSNEIPGTSGYQSHSKKSFETEANSDSDEKRNEILFKGAHNYFGLFGVEEDDEVEKPNYFEHLPQHVLETIFCHLPYLELLKMRAVCSEWRTIINDENFVEWKKRYYGLVRSSSDSRLFMETACARNGLNDVEDCFVVLLRFMYTEFKRKPSSDMYKLLMETPKAVQAELVIAERYPELLKKETKVWAIFACSLILSETVEDVCEVHKKLLSVQSSCPQHDVTDAFYCVAAFFYYYKKHCGINHGHHYRVYCTLYWSENDVPSKNLLSSESRKVVMNLPGQQSIRSYCESTKSHLTNEQLRILNHRFQPDQIIKIIALAGTGKTTTLIHLALLYPQVKFLNVVFNKAACEEAKRRFPPNVTCKTAHSLAYAVFGFKLRYKLINKIRPLDLVPFLKHNAGTKMLTLSYAKHVLQTIETFACTSDEELSLWHLRSIEQEFMGRYTAEDKQKVLKDATQIWKKMTDRNHKNLKVTHDMYLKLYQLSKPKLPGYQCIMVDEAQDCNPATLDIMMSQNCPVIFVGDPNQQIYGFRGARNALRKVNPTHTYYLTKSFRFGPQIAYAANCCLDVLMPGHNETLVGSNKPSCIDGKAVGKQYAIITRTNVQLFNEALRVCCLGRFKPNEPTVVHGCFVGGLKSYGFDQMLDICNLAVGPNQGPTSIIDKFIGKFKTFEELNSYARQIEDNDLISKIELIHQYGILLPGFIRKIKEKCNTNIALANFVFSTAHKAKGLEFDTVCLTDDYPITPSIDFQQRRVIDSEEANIMYVAMTRAKKSLVLSEKLLRLLLAAQEKFEYPVSPSSLLLNGETKLECVSCSITFSPHTVLILARRTYYCSSTGYTFEGGAMCVKCATDPTVRPRVDAEPVIMYLDPIPDYTHRSLSALVGPLPNDPPVVHASFEVLRDRDVVYVVNVNM